MSNVPGTKRFCRIELLVEDELDDGALEEPRVGGLGVN
jgi:hypothetical protein